MAESLLGLLGIGDELLYDDPFVGFDAGSELFGPKAGTDGRVLATRSPKLLFFNPQEFPAEKAPGTLRIFALGGSTTAGRPYDDRLSFARWLERYLDAAEPSRRHEVINAGAISYASYRVALLVRELVRYEPDLFVLYTGHNEFLEERSYSELIHQPAAWRSFRIWLSGFRLAAVTRLARRRWTDPRVPGKRLQDDVVTRLDTFTGLDAYHRDDALRRDILAHFEANLERLAWLAEEHGVGLILIRPASNIRDFSPFKSEHGANADRLQRSRFRNLIEEGRELLEQGDAPSALVSLQQAREIDPEYAELHFLIGQALLVEGKPETAREAFVQAKELDVAPLRALEAISNAVLETADRRGLACLDLPSILEEKSFGRTGHRILGNEVFLDHVHPDIPTHSLIAERLLDHLVASGEVAAEPSWTPQARKEIFDQVIASLDPEDYARRDLNLAKVLGWAGKLQEAEAPLLRAAEVLDGEPDLHLNLGVLWLKTGRVEEAIGQLERAVDLAPESAIARFNLGVAYGRLGQIPAGLSELQQALRLDPEYAEALHNLGVLYHESGQPEEAIRALEEALAFDPEVASIHRALGLALQDDGRLPEAERSLRSALRLERESIDGYRQLAAVLDEAGRPAEAEELLRTAIALDPGDDSDLLFQLGLTLAHQGKGDEARTAYLEVVDSDPAHAPAHNNLGLLEAIAGNFESADRYLRRALVIDPGYSEAWLNLAVLSDRAGDPELAIDAAARAVALEPDNDRYRLALGTLLQAVGRAEEARIYLEAPEIR